MNIKKNKRKKIMGFIFKAKCCNYKKKNLQAGLFIKIICKGQAFKE